MATCHYEQVSVKTESNIQNEPVQSWKPFIRQLLVCSGLWTTYFVSGLSVGAPTVVIPQLRREANSTAAISDEYASWLSSSLSYSAMPWVIILPVVTRVIGRKTPFIFASTTCVASFIVFYFGTTSTHFLISQILQGVIFASNLTVSIIMVTEYTSPQYRGVFLTLKSASVYWGMWASNAIGTFLEWNYIGLFGIACSVTYISIFFWPESPYWLASRGRFDECRKSHRWLKGTDKNSERELEYLIESQREYLGNSKDDSNFKDKIVNFSKSIYCSEFYKPVLLGVLIMAQFHASGKIVCSIYSIEMIKKITESESAGYTGMLILDGVSVFGNYFGCFLSKFLRRRTQLLWTSSIGISFLFIMSLYLWFVKLSFITESKILSIALLAAFSIAISCGPMIMSTSIYGELIPLRFKSSAVIVVVMLHFIFLSTSIKMGPFIFKTFSLQGTFCFYGILTTILTIAIYKYLPETKDKTFQEIEAYFVTDKKCETKKDLLTPK